MSETILDYDKTNKYLPESLRQFVGTADRITHQDFMQFIPFYTGVELSAVFNNRQAAEFAGGFTNLNYQYLRAGAAPRLLKIFVSKTVGRVWYQAKDDNEITLNEKLDSDYFSDKLAKATKEAAMTGRSIMVVYPKRGAEQEVEIGTYNLFRHRIKKDNAGKVIEAWIYLVRIDSKDAGSRVICEHRFYSKIKEPMQEWLLYTFDDRYLNKATPIVVDKDNIPEDFKKQYKDVNFESSVKLDWSNLGVYDINETLDNSKFPDVDIPESMFVDALDNGVCLDSSITGKEVEKEIGRGRVLLPEFEQFQTGFQDQDLLGGRVLRSISTNINNPIITPYPSRNIEDSKPVNVQFDIRSDQWIAQINDDTARLCACVGISVIDYDPRLLQAGQRTDDEINAMTDITANTVKEFRNLNQKKINMLLTDAATFFNLNVKVSIRWSMASILNPTKNTDLVTRQLQAGLIPRKEAIRRANPDLSQSEIDDLYKAVMAERGAEAIENSFDNF